jgi:methanol--5-hydroxybenzimidazolylcobamide Co-methyltransferase
MPEYHSLSINNLNDFIFGISPQPVILQNGLTIGGGTVYPELNFTLPDMIINADSMPEVCNQYTQMVTDASKRAAELHAPGLVVEFELLPDLTLTPEWGAEVVKILKDVLNTMENHHGLKTALRVTPNDIREFARPPIMKSGEFVDKMYRCFHLCADAGADLFSIESTGGKEIHDDAILNGNLDLSVLGLGILGSRDMVELWKNIVDISHQHGVIPAGDSACGFANTAMVLAEQRYIPKVWAAVIRVMSVPRSLIAFEQGALGPSKDCAYEGPYLKAITGCPISLEGAEAAVAHLSPIGNIAKAVPDLWSNESVNNVKLLGGMAPTVSLEQLVYATRLMNSASNHGRTAAVNLRNLFVESDVKYDPQAYVLKLEVVLELAEEIIKEPSAYLRTRKAAQTTLMKLRQAGEVGELIYSKIEMRWLDRLTKSADLLPEDEEEFIINALVDIDHSKIRLKEYGVLG